jgi:hypothetical protein
LGRALTGRQNRIAAFEKTSGGPDRLSCGGCHILFFSRQISSDPRFLIA